MNRETQSSLEKTVILVEEIFNKLPLAYKRIITFSNCLMVLSGMKSVTNLSFIGDVWNERDFSVFKEVLESVGLNVSEVETRYSKDGDNIPIRHIYIYNKSLLALQTRNSDLVPPYEEKMTIEEYMKMAQNSAPIGAIHGKLFSFPESAIRDFLKTSDERGGNDERIYFRTGNEVYWVYPPVQDDVKERERKKEVFFSKIENTSTLKNILMSTELKNSNEEWIKRLSKSMNKK